MKQLTGFSHIPAKHFRTGYSPDPSSPAGQTVGPEDGEEVGPAPSSGCSDSSVPVWHETSRTGRGKTVRQDIGQHFPPQSNSQAMYVGVCYQCVQRWRRLPRLPRLNLIVRLWRRRSRCLKSRTRHIWRRHKQTQTSTSCRNSLKQTDSK